MSLWDDLGDVASVVFPVAYNANKVAYDKIFGGPDVPPPAPIPKPPPPPDVTDQALQQARLSARRRSLLGMGLDSTFLTNPFTDGGAVSLSGTGY